MSSRLLEATLVPEVALPEVLKAENAPESIPVAPVADLSHDEPVVTRRELWSYYRVYPYLFCLQYR